MPPLPPAPIPRPALLVALLALTVQAAPLRAAEPQMRELPPPPADVVARWLEGSWLGGPGGANHGHGFLYHFGPGDHLRIEHYDGTVVREPAGDFADRIVLSKNPRDYRPNFTGRYRITGIKGSPIEASLYPRYAQMPGRTPHEITLAIRADAPRPDTLDVIEAQLEIKPAFYNDPDEDPDEDNSFGLRWTSGLAYVGNATQPPKPLTPERLSWGYDKLLKR